MASRKPVKLDVIKNANRIVLKVGSSLLIKNKNGSINKTWMKSFAEDISTLTKSKKEILKIPKTIGIVTSEDGAALKDIINIIQF